MIDSSPPAGRHPIEIDKVVTAGGAGGDQVSEADSLRGDAVTVGVGRPGSRYFRGDL
jgi:hypothetical protein